MEDSINLDSLNYYVSLADSNNLKLLVRLKCHVVLRVTGDPADPDSNSFVPTWLESKFPGGLPSFVSRDDTVFGQKRYIEQVASWDDTVQSYFLAFLDSLKNREAFNTNRIAGVYITDLSFDTGEEFILGSAAAVAAEAAGMNPSNIESAYLERLRHWKGVVDSTHKLCFVGFSGVKGDSAGYDELIAILNDSCNAMGIGWRFGGIENYKNHFVYSDWDGADSCHLGQTMDENGYVVTDWSHPKFDSLRYGKTFFAEEGEIIFLSDDDPVQDTLLKRHQVHMMLLTAAQIGFKYLWISPMVVTHGDSMLIWYIKTAGKGPAEAEDGFCRLYETYNRIYTMDPQRKYTRRNIEKFVYHRKVVYGNTERDNIFVRPWIRWDDPEYTLDSLDSLPFEYLAAKTQCSTGNEYIGFWMDSTFKAGFGDSVDIKVTFKDTGSTPWRLVTRRENGSKCYSPSVTNGETNETRTVTFRVVSDFPDTSNVFLSGYNNENYDFYLENMSSEAGEPELSIYLVRVVKVR